MLIAPVGPYRDRVLEDGRLPMHQAASPIKMFATAINNRQPLIGKVRSTHLPAGATRYSLPLIALTLP
jgi:hypothetical protein